VKVFRALPPSTDVDPFDAVDGRDGAVDAADHHAELSGQIIGEFSRFTDVLIAPRRDERWTAARVPSAHLPPTVN